MITLALPSRGRLAQGAELLVKKIGLNLERPYRSLQSEDLTSGVKIVFIHHKDAGMLVEQGYVDIAVTAQDILAEHANDVSILAQLGFGQCQVVLAVQEDMLIYDVSDLEGRTIATSYPHLVRAWLAQRQVQCKIAPFHGSIEIMPALNVATAVVDNYQTGVSIRANRLRIVEVLMHSQAVLIGNGTALRDNAIMRLAGKLGAAARPIGEHSSGRS